MRPQGQAEAWVQFDACGDAWAMPARLIGEVLPFMAMDHPPGTPTTIVGWMNLAGTALPVVSIASLLGLADSAPGLFTPLLVLRGTPPWALRVDRVSEVFEVAAEECQPLADDAAFNGMVSGRVNRGDRTVFLLNPQRMLLEQEQRALLDFTRRQQARLAALDSPPEAGPAPAAPFAVA